MDLQVVHPMSLGRVYDLLEPAGANLSPECDGQHDLGTGVLQVLARQPEVREPPCAPERDLALRRAHVERAERTEAGADLFVDRESDRMPVEEGCWIHPSSVAHVDSIHARHQSREAVQHCRS